MSRSIRSRSFSRFSLAISAAWSACGTGTGLSKKATPGRAVAGTGVAAVAPPGCPYRRTQREIRVWWMPNSAATNVAVRPVLVTMSTTCRRYRPCTTATSTPAPLLLLPASPLDPSSSTSACWPPRNQGRINLSKRVLKATLATATVLASQAKGTYLPDKFHRLKARMGMKKAAMAVAHKISGRRVPHASARRRLCRPRRRLSRPLQQVQYGRAPGPAPHRARLRRHAPPQSTGPSDAMIHHHPATGPPYRIFGPTESPSGHLCFPALSLSWQQPPDPCNSAAEAVRLSTPPLPTPPVVAREPRAALRHAALAPAPPAAPAVSPHRGHAVRQAAQRFQSRPVRLAVQAQ